MVSRVVLLLGLVVGCAAPYEAAGLRGGYSELRLSERAWQVDFARNSVTSPRTAHSYVLRRAAELTLSSGYHAFYVADENSALRLQRIHAPLDCYQRVRRTECRAGGQETLKRPTTRLKITMISGSEASQAPPGSIVYDAKRILDGEIPRS